MQKTDDKRTGPSSAEGKRLAWSPPRLQKASIASETQAGAAGSTDSGIFS